MRLYEGMFLVESAVADRDWEGVCGEIDAVISRYGGKVVDVRKWDERRLAYEIKRTRRGTYILAHFEAPPASMEEMRRDFNLSERIVRQLIVVDTDGVPSGDERPGITTTVSEISRRMSRGPAGGSAREPLTRRATVEDGAAESAEEPVAGGEESPGEADKEEGGQEEHAPEPEGDESAGDRPA